VIGYGPKEGSVVSCKSDSNPTFLCIRFSSFCETARSYGNLLFSGSFHIVKLNSGMWIRHDVFQIRLFPGMLFFSL
jgi:hypothetical protein